MVARQCRCGCTPGNAIKYKLSSVNIYEKLRVQALSFFIFYMLHTGVGAT